METQVSIDKLDQEILRELKNDCTQSYKKLAEKLGTHVNTIIQHVQRLEREKVITGYSATINYQKIGYDYQGIALIRTSKLTDTKNMWLFDDVIKIPQVEALYAVTGSDDAFAIIRVKNRDEMVDVLKQVQDSEVVVKTNTLIILHTFKQWTNYNPL